MSIHRLLASIAVPLMCLATGCVPMALSPSQLFGAKKPAEFRLARHRCRRTPHQQRETGEDRANASARHDARSGRSHQIAMSQKIPSH